MGEHCADQRERAIPSGYPPARPFAAAEPGRLLVGGWWLTCQAPGAAFTRKAATPSIYYRESAGGLTWSAVEGAFLGDTPSVGFATDIVLVYRYIHPYDGIYVRVGE